MQCPSGAVEDDQSQKSNGRMGNTSNFTQSVIDDR